MLRWCLKQKDKHQKKNGKKFSDNIPHREFVMVCSHKYSKYMREYKFPAINASFQKNAPTNLRFYSGSESYIVPS